jgi:hypothetical protein
MLAKDLELLASMELRWFEPNDARKLIDSSISLGLLEESSNGLKPTFDISSINIPIGFTPPKDLISTLEHDEESLFIKIVNQITLATSIDAEKVIADINANQVKNNDLLTLEVLAILYGEANGVDMEKFIPMVKSRLLSSSDKK